jgi:hypothetical protein
MTDHEERQLREILDRLRSVEDRVVSVEQNVLVGNQEVFNNALYLEAILGILRGTSPATSGAIRQLGGSMPTNLSIVAGTTGTFQVTWNGAMGTTPPVWSSSDPNVTLATVSSDATGNTETAAVATTDTASTFVLTANGTNSVGASVVATATITITPATPAPATSGVINQLS